MATTWVAVLDKAISLKARHKNISAHEKVSLFKRKQVKKDFSRFETKFDSVSLKQNDTSICKQIEELLMRKMHTYRTSEDWKLFATQF